MVILSTPVPATPITLPLKVKAVSARGVPFVTTFSVPEAVPVKEADKPGLVASTELGMSGVKVTS